MDNQLQVIVKESGLEQTKAQLILEKFQDYFEIAAEWEKKAKAIVVTKADQVTDMEMARTARLFLRGKRIDVENTRKALKEQALREGKAIDGIANVLKALIVPIEQYLDRQEHFVKIQEENEREAKRIEVEKRIEEERIAKEKAEEEERERIRQENEKLKKEAEEREKRMEEERKERDKRLAETEAKARAEREAAEKKARIEREKQEKRFAEEKAKAEAERRVAEEKAAAEKAKANKKAEKERKEKERLAQLLKNQIVCPKCGHKFQNKTR